MRFAMPKQVVFDDGENICGGIAYGNEIICACCGGVFEIDDVEIIDIFSDWVNFEEYIR